MIGCGEAKAVAADLSSPLVWTTLSLTIHAAGSAEHTVAGASPFPRHWIYDAAGRLSHKSGLLEMKDWAPPRLWQGHTMGSRGLARHRHRGRGGSGAGAVDHHHAGGAKPKTRRLKEGRILVEQGEPGNELYLLLDGVLSVEVDGRPSTEVSPGVVLGERAILEGGRRTSTLRAVTDCRVAVAEVEAIDRAGLERPERGPPPRGPVPLRAGGARVGSTVVTGPGPHPSSAWRRRPVLIRSGCRPSPPSRSVEDARPP